MTAGVEGGDERYPLKAGAFIPWGLIQFLSGYRITMDQIRIKRGFDLPLEGRPVQDIQPGPAIEQAALRTLEADGE